MYLDQLHPSKEHSLQNNYLFFAQIKSGFTVIGNTLVYTSQALLLRRAPAVAKRMKALRWCIMRCVFDT